jgi:hypothetical protein
VKQEQAEGASLYLMIGAGATGACSLWLAWLCGCLLAGVPLAVGLIGYSLMGFAEND